LTPAHECLYDVAWQRHRLRYVTQFDTEPDTRAAIHNMLSYIGRAKTRYWKFVRVWRCINILPTAYARAERAENATGMKLLKKFERALKIEYERYRGAHHGPMATLFQRFDWDKVKSDLEALYSKDPDMFRALQQYSEGRLYRPGKTDPTSPLARPELGRFVRMMRDVVFEHG
jgi:hypothetical protein